MRINMTALGTSDPVIYDCKVLNLSPPARTNPGFYAL